MKNLRWYLARVVQFPKSVLKVDIRLVLVDRQYGAFIEYGKEVLAQLDFETEQAARWWAECRCRWILLSAKAPVVVTLVETTDGQYVEIGRYVVRVGEVTVFDHFDR